MTQKSGQVMVTNAGSPVPVGEAQVNGALMLKALAGNSGLIWVGNDGQGEVSSASGMQLKAGELVVFDWVGCLGSLMIDAEVSGEGAAWLALDI